MAPPLLTLQNIHLTFGGTPLLEGADFAVHERDRLCLVGRNGSGKSTLLKIAAGLIEADDGERFVQPGTTIRYMPQEPDLSDFATVEAYALSSLGPGDDPHRVTYLLGELGLTATADPSNLSGGETRRAALAWALAPQPDILMLDEPTNHLDLPAIEWLEKELSSLRSAIILISHDRRFLETLSRRTLWIDRGVSRFLDKGFDAFEAWRDEVLEQEEQDRHKLDRKIHRENQWVIHGVSARRKRNMKRLGDLYKLREERERLAERGRRAEARAALTVSEGQTSGKLVIEAKGLSKSWGELGVVRDLDLKILRGDRIGIVGPNGAGKTTLLKMITGELEPDAGSVRHGTKLEVVTLDQKREALAPTTTLQDALTDGRGDMVMVGDQQRHVMSYMKDFLFQPEQARTPIEALSGGERGRLMLARAFARPSNLLVLDEPTNDLDLETLDLLQELLGDYGGTVFLVSHDRDFLDRVVTSILVSEGDGRWEPYPGGYSDMVRQRGAQEAPTAEKTKPVKKEETFASVPPAKKRKLSFKEKHALETLPKEMAKLEEEAAILKEKLADPEFFNRDAEGFQKSADRLGKIEADLETHEEEWLRLEMLREELEGA